MEREREREREGERGGERGMQYMKLSIYTKDQTIVYFRHFFAFASKTKHLKMESSV